MEFLKSTQKILQTLAFTSTLIISSTAQAGLIFDEDELGDFVESSPPTFAFIEGTNQVLGNAVWREISKDVWDIDWDTFLFRITDGFTLKAIRYSAFAEAPEGSILNINYQLKSGSSVVATSKVNLLSWSVQNIFTDATSYASGLYSFSHLDVEANFEGRPWRYTIEFDVVSNNPAPVNAPGTLLLLSGVFGLLTWRRRNQ
jgi:hypothetical protein